MLKNLDEGKMYHRQLRVNVKPVCHKEFLECERGYYINGVEFFKVKNFYWFKTWTAWDNKVCVNSMFKLNRDGKILKYYLNTFGFSGGKCVVWKHGGEQEDLNEWIGLIIEHLDSDDDGRKIVLKARSQLK